MYAHGVMFMTCINASLCKMSSLRLSSIMNLPSIKCHLIVISIYISFWCMHMV